MSNPTEIINLITAIAMIILFIMLILLGVFAVFYFKSKNGGKEKKNEVNDNSNNITVKNYNVESVFDFMEFDKIEDNMISVKNGTKYVMVVECQGVNYDLMSEVEKNSVEEGFIQFLNTLRHPIQIYTQTRTINLDGSIKTYKTKIQEIENELEKEKKKYESMVKSGQYTKEQLNAAFYELTKTTNLYEYGKDIIYNTERMSLNKNVLNQRYYIAVPYFPDELGDNDFDKQEIKSLAFSELYTRAQSIVRTLSVCGVNGRILDSNDLVDLLYVAYNRDDAENFGLDKALKAGYDELYSTAPDVIDKKMKALNERIEEEAYKKANEKVVEAKSDKQRRLEEKEDQEVDLVAELAQYIIEQNKSIVGEDIAKDAVKKIQEETKEKKETAKNKRTVVRKKTIDKEGGTK